MPSPTDTELRVQLSPVPTQTTFGSDGSSAIAPMDWTGCLSKTGLNVVPPSSDFQTPPEAAPTNSVTLPSSSTRPATAAMRPLIGPSRCCGRRGRRSLPESTAGGAAGGAGATRGGDGDARRRSAAVFIGPLPPSLRSAAGNANASVATATFASALS